MLEELINSLSSTDKVPAPAFCIKNRVLLRFTNPVKLPLLVSSSILLLGLNIVQLSINSPIIFLSLDFTRQSNTSWGCYIIGLVTYTLDLLSVLYAEL